MLKCSFCKATSTSEKFPEGWGRAKLLIPGRAPVDITFCPLHRKEAEAKLDLAFTEGFGRRNVVDNKKD